ncbi:MAG TPA: RidA family protein [Chitinophagales bacterium]|nr:RidA family protein [Chitinophagales bacterium]
MKKSIIQTNQAPAAIGPYSQAVKAGNFLFVSGQVPIDPETGNVVIGGIESETHRVMKNLEAILIEAGSSFKDVVKATLFIKNMEDFAKINAVYAGYFDKNFPARETVEISQLPRNANIEISVVALLDN